MENLKYVLKITIILIISQIGVAQNAAPIWDFMDENSGYTYIFEEFDKDKTYLTINKSTFPSPMYRNNMIIFDEDGNQLIYKEIAIDSFDIYWNESRYIASSNKIMLFGVATKKLPFSYLEYDHLVTMFVDEFGNYDQIKFTKLSSELGYRSIGYHFDGQNYKIVISSDFAFLDYPDIPEIYFETTFLDMTADGEVLNMEYLKSTEPSCQCILPSLIDDGYHCPGVTGYNLDQSMNIKGTEINRNGSTLAFELWASKFLVRINQRCFLWSNHTYLISNTSFGSFGSNVNNENVVVFNYTPKDYKLKKYYTTGFGRVAFLKYSMDISYDSTIYTGNNYLSLNNNFNEVITLAKLNKHLDKIWELKLTVEDKTHVVGGIKATSDTCFVIFGFRKNKGESDGVPFLMKFDKNGGIKSSLNDNAIQYVKSYPNPSSGPLTFDIKGIGNAEIRIFDVLGHNVYVQDVSQEGETSMDLSALSDGTYVYKIYQGSKEIGSGLWVKQ
ncbi:MAG: T9SS type A sorting domain-containing protein [Saprospiraceae bacterium]|nr:T9SS type A sorting domain-containing protein [Saprospiraceae bacterium]MBP9056090.1 T9SS type A sorting domain-containing protein [Saprospiraceae bacterium]HRG41960.1 T9SS type A sorting domain-containing protein [Saprospiraceae bacterium]